MTISKAHDRFETDFQMGLLQKVVKYNVKN